MKLDVNREEMVRVLRALSRVTSKRASMPILRDVQLEAAEGAAVATASDLEVTATLAVPEAETLAAGRCCVDAEGLLARLQRCNSERATLEADRGLLQIEAGATRYAMEYSYTDEFPIVPAPKEPLRWETRTEELQDAFACVAWCACDDETRYNLNGVHLLAGSGEDSGWWLLEATDGRRAARLQRKQGKAVVNTIVPNKAIESIRTVVPAGSECEVALDEAFLSIVWAGGELRARMVQGEFPQTESLYAEAIGQQGRLHVDRREMLALCKRAAVATTRDKPWVRLHGKAGSESLAATTFGNGFEESLPAALSLDLDLGVNASYLVAAMESRAIAGAERLTIYYSEPKWPLVFSWGQCDVLVMPIVLGEKDRA